jgi:cytochrome c oxidase subunit 2
VNSQTSGGRRLFSVAGRVGLALAPLVVAGCAAAGPMSTLPAQSDFNRAILGVYGIIAWASAAILLVVFAALGWVLLRFRERPGTLPSQTRGHTVLEIGWTIAPALVLLVIAIPTIQVIFRTQAVTRPPDALEVTVRGLQWWWEFRYPQLDVVTANELHLPAGRPVVFTLQGPDVIHSFWIPQLGGKRDVVPGRENALRLTPEAPGEYWGQCAEFCGAAHANMGMRVVVDTPERFAAWATAQQAPPATPSETAAAGRDLYARLACVGCHTIRGVSAGTLGPDLTHFGSRRTVGAGMWPNTVDNVAAWLQDPPALKPGVKMPNLGLTTEQAHAIATYLLELE